MKVMQILREKGATVYTTSPHATVRTAIDWLNTHRIGALVVLDEGGGLVGIVSERDIIEALARSDSRVLSERVSTIMTRDVITCAPEDRLDDLMAVMTRRRVRHLVVIDGGRLAGIVSIGDLVKAQLTELELKSSVLRDAYLRVR